jgi:hypothetical protein
MTRAYDEAGRHDLTWEVMAVPAGSTYPEVMTRTTRSALIAAAVLAAFGAYSVWVCLGHGFTGFLTLARDEPWGLQLLLDLVIACSFGVGWMHADARKRGLASWPFLPVVLLLGSIGLLSYVVVRGLRAPVTSAPVPAA